MCMFADNLISFIKYPLFVVQSLYDSWSIQNILGIDCVAKFSLSTCSQEER
jgi:O-palmitoleoyl-L-serine hydrolase